MTLRTFGNATCWFLVCRLLGKFYFFSSHDYEIEACSLTASEQWVMFHICRRRRCGRRRRSYRSAMMRSERRHFLRITIMIMKILAKRFQDGYLTAPRRSKTAYSLLFCLHEAQGCHFVSHPFNISLLAFGGGASMSLPNPWAVPSAVAISLPCHGGGNAGSVPA